MINEIMLPKIPSPKLSNVFVIAEPTSAKIKALIKSWEK